MRKDEQRITSIGVRAKCTFVCLFVGVLLLSCSHETPAGAENGEFLGYRIGQKYPITNSTKLSSSYYDWAYFVEAEHPLKPDEFGTVYLAVTKKTYTILAITSSRDFASEQQRIDFANKYIRILSAQYPSTPKSSGETGTGESSTAFFFGPEDRRQKGFTLGVTMWARDHYSPFTGNHPVHIGLTYRSNYDLYDQALRESAERAREEAGKKGLNRGL